MGRFIYKPAIDNPLSIAKVQRGELFSDAAGVLYFHDRSGNIRKLSDYEIANINGLQAELDSLQSAINGKADASHNHAISDISGLQTALDGKAASSHGHSIANISGLQAALDAKLDDSQRGTANGVAPLGSDGKVPLANLPDDLGSGGGGGGGNTTSHRVVVTNWAAGTWTLPDGWTAVKVHGGASMQLTHSLNKNPVSWMLLGRDSTPAIQLVPTSLRNLQVVDTNTVIVSSVSASTFDLTLSF